jgi:hypothetical protein
VRNGQRHKAFQERVVSEGAFHPIPVLPPSGDTVDHLAIGLEDPAIPGQVMHSKGFEVEVWDVLEKDFPCFTECGILIPHKCNVSIPVYLATH